MSSLLAQMAEQMARHEEEVRTLHSELDKLNGAAAAPGGQTDTSSRTSSVVSEKGNPGWRASALKEVAEEEG